jgi:hypothetical protein
VIINNGFDTPTSITIEMWINPNNITDNKYVTNDFNRKAIIIGYQDNYFNIYTYPTGTASDTQIPATKNQWQYIVYTVNGTSVKGYKNGQMLINVVGSLLSGGTTYTFGRDSGGFNGYVDQVRIYNYARTPAQIAWDYNRGKPMAEWRFDKGSGTTAVNSVANSSHGTMYNMEATDWVAGKFGKALDFDGSNEYVGIGDTNLNLNAVSFWVNADSLTDSIIHLDGATHEVTVSNGNILAGGFSSPSIYVDSELNKKITLGNWHHVLIKTATSFEASSMNIGRIQIGYFDGRIDAVKIFSYEPTAEQVKLDMNNGAAMRFE